VLCIVAHLGAPLEIQLSLQTLILNF